MKTFKVMLSEYPSTIRATSAVIQTKGSFRYRNADYTRDANSTSEHLTSDL